jgi:hypothetical protein
MSIPPIQNSVLSYFRTFDLKCVARARDGRLISTRDPAGHEMAWWCRAVDVARIIRRARVSGDVPAAAAALGVRLIDHGHAVRRAEGSVRRLNARMMQAQRTGALVQFNHEYKRRRQEAFVRGKPFMPYTAARARLRQVLVEAKADRALPASLMTRIFEP